MSCARSDVLSAAAALAAALLLAGCVSMEVPDDFLVVAKGADEIKAVTADDAKIWVREFSDWDQGDLSFWSEALKHDLVDNRGYTLLEEGDAVDASGTPGKEYLFEVTAGGEARRYLLSVFVLEGWWYNTIPTVEYLAPKAVFDRYLAEVRKSVTTLDP